MTKNSIVPMYKQLAETIKQQILSGELKESERLMTESELCDKYNVSRITVRQAINLLVESEYVTKRQGIGTFVTPKKLGRIMNPGKPMSFTEICAADGKKSSAEILSVKRCKAEKRLASELEIAVDSEILKIVRVRKSDGIPVMIEETYIPSKYSYVTEGDLSGSIYAILCEHGTFPAHAKKTISIFYATEREEKYLEVNVKDPLLFHNDLVMDEKGNVILVSKLVINPERFVLTIEF